MSDKSLIEKASDTMGNVIEKAGNIMENVTKFQKQSKLKAGYLERDEFKDSNLHKGFFCYNCIYWIDMTGGKCMIVDDKGPDLFGNVSDVIAPHGCCNGYEPDFDEINEQKEVVVDEKK
ncbi:MAG TPA: hypothetical protein VFP49_05615 [Nitrososphaeraceae archaeon]|jgi:hypothetical protein|nr:hypothetical protein [Nitrososphaeraceae archaeon]